MGRKLSRVLVHGTFWSTSHLEMHTLVNFHVLATERTTAHFHG